MERKTAYLVDFDGTITTRDITNELAFYFGGEAYLEIERQYSGRLIPIREWLHRTASLMPADLDLMLGRALELATVRDGFEEFVDLALKRQSPVVIASDGFGFYIEPILKRCGISLQALSIYRNDTYLPGGKKRLEVSNPHAHPVCPVCGNCKAEHVYRLKELGYSVVYVGDGANDRFGASWADHLCARDELAQSCRENGIKYTRWEDFFDVIRVADPPFREREDVSLCLPRGRGIKKQ